MTPSDFTSRNTSCIDGAKNFFLILHLLKDQTSQIPDVVRPVFNVTHFGHVQKAFCYVKSMRLTFKLYKMRFPKSFSPENMLEMSKNQSSENLFPLRTSKDLYPQRCRKIGERVRWKVWN